MFRKISNKALVVIFAVLAVVAVIVFLHDRKTGDRTFKSELFTIDSANVTSVKIYPKGKKTDPLILEKAGNNWNIVVGPKKYPADSAAIGNILRTLAHVSAERVAASDASGWKSFELTDSLARRVVVQEGNEVTADFMVGKISYSQGQGMQSRGGNQGFSIKSHIRTAGDDRVYVVDGFLSVVFSDQPSQYRNRLVCRFDRNQVNKLTFGYPGDSSFVLTRSGDQWMLNDKPADSAKAVNFISSLANTTGSEFADEESLPFTFPFSLRIEGNNMPAIDLTGAFDPVKKMYYIRSSANTSAVFGSANTSLFNRVFASKSRF